MKQEKYNTNKQKSQGPQRGRMFLVVIPADLARSPYTWDVDPEEELVPVIRDLLGETPVFCSSPVQKTWAVAYSESGSIFRRLNVHATNLVGRTVNGMAVVVQSGRRIRPWSKYAAKRVIRQITGGDDNV